MNSKMALVWFMVLGVLLTAVSAFIPISGSNTFCKEDIEFKLYNDVKRGVPLAYYKSAEQCGDIACKFKPGDPCQSDLKVLRREFKPVNFIADVGFWALFLFGVRRLVRKGFK